MLATFASSIVYRRLRLSRGSPPPLAAIMIFLATLLQSFPRLASVAPLARLIFDQCECPAMCRDYMRRRRAHQREGCTTETRRARRWRGEDGRRRMATR